MKKSLITFMVIFGTITTIALFAFKAATDEKVKGWFLAGSYPQGYAIGVENSPERNGHVAFLKSTQSLNNRKFGTIMQEFIPEDYLGKRVRLTGYIKSADVKGWAGMWFRIDGEPRTTQLGFDNMQNRAIKGTTDWKKYDIVLDVPANSKFIAFGVLLTGTGTVWLDDLHFDIVSNTTPGTNIIPPISNKPQNTNFEESEN
jgi:hypothetical protein